MFVSLDLETTGFDPKKDKIVEFGAVKFDLSGSKESLRFFINPGVPLPQITTHITGITDKDLASAQSIQDKKDEIAAFIGDLPIVGHNISFDTSFLKQYGIAKDNLEFDTLQFAGILFPSLPSYSLEILSDMLKLTHVEKHRALDDSIAAMELFLKLTDLFRQLDPELIKKIHEIVQRSNWDMKNFIMTLSHIQTIQEQVAAPAIESIEKSDITIPTDKNCLFEACPPFTPLILSNLKRDICVAIPNDNFHEMLPAVTEDVSAMDSSKNYLSPKRLETFGKKEFFQNYEVTALIKYVIWSKQTKTGLLRELNLFGQEKSTLSSVNVDPEFGDTADEPFLKKDKEKATLATHEYLIDELPKLKKLILVDFESFTSRLHYQLSSYISLRTTINYLEELKSLGHETESLISKLTIFFGLIGIIFDKYNDADFFTPKSTINEDILATKEWKDLVSLSKNLLIASNALPKTPEIKRWLNIVNEISDIFENTNLQDYLIWFEKDFNQEAVIRKCPISIKENIAKILGNCETYTIVDENIDLNDDGKFLKNLFGLPNDLPIQKAETSKEKIAIDISTDCPERDPENSYVLMKFLEKELPKTKGKAAVLFNSKKQLEYFTLKLTPILSKSGIALVSQLTGSINKVCEQFKQNPENSIVFLTTFSWERFTCSDSIETLYLHKLPFQPPSSPYLMSIGRNFKNSFMDFQIPRAVFGLKRILNRLKKGRAVILDSRVATRDYSKMFLDYLKDIGEISSQKIC